MNITKKGTGRRMDWAQIRAQLEIYLEERLEKVYEKFCLEYIS